MDVHHTESTISGDDHGTVMHSWIIARRSCSIGVSSVAAADR